VLSAFLRIKQTPQHSKEGFKGPIKRSACPLSFHDCLKEPSFLVFVGLLTLTAGNTRRKKMPKLSSSKIQKITAGQAHAPQNRQGCCRSEPKLGTAPVPAILAVSKWEPRQGLAQPLSAKARSSKHHFHILVVSSQMWKLSRAAGLPL